MAESDPPGLAAALLKWARAFQTSRNVQNWSDLQDGRVLWEILQDIDPGYFDGDLPEPLSRTEDHWIPRWQNLKQVYRMVTAYLRDSSDSIENPAGNLIPDLKAIATDASRRDTITLLKLMLRAAMYSPESNQRMGRIVVGLGPEVAMTIAAAMKQMEEADFIEPEGIRSPERLDFEATPDAGTPMELLDDATTLEVERPTTGRPSADRDPELEQEEKLIRAYKTIHELQASNEKAATELAELRQDKEELQQAFDAFKYEVEHEGRKTIQSDTIAELQGKVDRDRDYIAEIETELDKARTTSSAQERQIARYKEDTDVKQKLRDDLQLLRAERDELLQKSRASENLKKKIQALQDQEKANANLKEDLRVANEQLQELDRYKERCEMLRKANEESLNLIANGEQEIFDQKTNKKRLEHEYKVIAQKYEAARERASRDHETITELENRLQTYELGGPVVDGDANGLEDEIAASENANLKADAQRSQPQDADMLSADATVLQQKLAALAARNAKLEAEYLEILQDKLGLETAIQDLREPSREPEENVPFLEQRKKLQAAQEELSELKTQHFGAQSELASIKDKLLAAEQLLASEGGAQSLDSNTEYKALKDRYSELQQHSESIETQLSDQRSLLRHALLNSSALSKEPDDIRAGNEYKLVVQQLHAVREAPAESDVLENTAAALADKIENGQAASKRSDEQSAEIVALKEKLATAPTQLKPTKEYETLQRENRLMTTAWFDLSSRLQSNTVTLARRREAPKSFLGKQRMIITPQIVGQHR